MYTLGNNKGDKHSRSFLQQHGMTAVLLYNTNKRPPVDHTHAVDVLRGENVMYLHEQRSSSACTCQSGGAALFLSTQKCEVTKLKINTCAVLSAVLYCISIITSIWYRQLMELQQENMSVCAVTARQERHQCTEVWWGRKQDLYCHQTGYHT